MLGQLTQHEYEYQRNQRTQTYLRLSRLRYAASLEEVTCSQQRNFSREQLAPKPRGRMQLD